MEHIHDLSAKLQKGDFAYLGGVFGDGLALFRFEQAVPAMLILASAKLQKKAIYHCISPSIPCRFPHFTDAANGVNR